MAEENRSSDAALQHAQAAKRAAWQAIKERVHAYARDPSKATASKVESAFRALRDQEDEPPRRLS